MTLKLQHNHLQITRLSTEPLLQIATVLIWNVDNIEYRFIEQIKTL